MSPVWGVPCRPCGDPPVSPAPREGCPCAGGPGPPGGGTWRRPRCRMAEPPPTPGPVAPGWGVTRGLSHRPGGLALAKGGCHRPGGCASGQGPVTGRGGWHRPGGLSLAGGAVTGQRAVPVAGGGVLSSARRAVTSDWADTGQRAVPLAGGAVTGQEGLSLARFVTSWASCHQPSRPSLARRLCRWSGGLSPAKGAVTGHQAVTGQGSCCQPSKLSLAKGGCH